MQKKYIASCSMGKDSLAMVLRLVEEKWPLDEVIYYENGGEYQCIMENARRMEEYLQSNGIAFTKIVPDKSFVEYMTQRTLVKRDGSVQNGYHWCGGRVRWGTMQKLEAIRRHYRENYSGNVIVEYVGIASDERQRIMRLRSAKSGIKVYPLVHWDMKEADCLQYCYDRGWNWREVGYELYDLLDRVSCRFCTNKNLKELRNTRRFLPHVWNELRCLQEQIPRHYRNGVTVHELEERFRSEEITC